MCNWDQQLKPLFLASVPGTEEAPVPSLEVIVGWQEQGLGLGDNKGKQLSVAAAQV